MEDSVGDEMSANGCSSTRNQWVSFEEDCDVPLLPQPPNQDDNMNSKKYIDRLGIKSIWGQGYIKCASVHVSFCFSINNYSSVYTMKV